MYQHILVPTDGSELANKAVAEGAKLARMLGSKLTVLAVLVPIHIFPDYGPEGEKAAERARREAQAFLEAEGKSRLGAALSIARSVGVDADAIWLENSFPYEAIINTAAAKMADLIVIGSHGRSGVAAAVLGSVTQKVLHHTKLPVLVVRSSPQCPARIA
jgi:nucleotide-binding universal stress UspA family protein